LGDATGRLVKQDDVGAVGQQRADLDDPPSPRRQLTDELVAVGTEAE
jgi:hypothetical protein